MRNLLTAIMMFSVCLASGRAQQTKASQPLDVAQGANQSERAFEVAGASRFVQFQGFKVHYVDAGKGSEAIVFIHGWACNLRFWGGQMAFFGSRMRALAIDLPGHGLSDKPHVDYTMDLYAQAIDAVLRDAGIERAVFVGHSNGTPVIRQFYRHYPQKTAALVVVDGALRPFGDRATMEKFLAPLHAPNYQENAGKFIDFLTRPVKDPPLRDEIKSEMLKTPQYVSVSEIENSLDPAIWTPDKIQVPLLVILAKQTAWTADYEAFVRGLDQNVEYISWDGVSHFLMMERPAEFNRTVVDFLIKNKLARE